MPPRTNCATRRPFCCVHPRAVILAAHHYLLAEPVSVGKGHRDIGHTIGLQGGGDVESAKGIAGRGRVPNANASLHKRERSTGMRNIDQTISRKNGANVITYTLMKPVCSPSLKTGPRWRPVPQFHAAMSRMCPGARVPIHSLSNRAFRHGGQSEGVPAQSERLRCSS